MRNFLFTVIGRLGGWLIFSDHLEPVRVPYPFAFGAKGWVWTAKSCRKSDFHLQYLTVIDPYRSRFADSIRPKAAPRPLFGLAHQSTFDRVAMHVAKLFDALAFRPDIKIVESALPDFSCEFGPREFRSREFWKREPCPLRRASRDRRRIWWAKRCLSTCITIEGVVICGSLMRRWKCSGMST